MFLSVVDLEKKVSQVLCCGANEISLAEAAFPQGKQWDSCGEEGANTRTLASLGIERATSCRDVGKLCSRKKEFKPAVDGALQAGWTAPAPAAADAAGGDGGAGTSAAEKENMLVVDTNTATQELSRTYSIKGAAELQDDGFGRAMTDTIFGVGVQHKLGFGALHAGAEANYRYIRIPPCLWIP